MTEKRKPAVKVIHERDDYMTLPGLRWFVVDHDDGELYLARDLEWKRWDIAIGGAILMRSQEEAEARLQAWYDQEETVKQNEPPARAEQTVEVRGVWLRKEGEYAVVEAWMPDGSYREVIREHLDGTFSHCVHAAGIRKAPESRNS